MSRQRLRAVWAHRWANAAGKVCKRNLKPHPTRHDPNRLKHSVSRNLAARHRLPNIPVDSFDFLHLAPPLDTFETCMKNRSSELLKAEVLLRLV